MEAFPPRSVSILSGELRGFRAEVAAACSATSQFATRQRRDFEHGLEFQSRCLVRLLSCRWLSYFFIRSVIVVQRSLPMFSYWIALIADVALAVCPLTVATSLNHANINPGGGSRWRLCEEVML
jgi:hypothetical protein